jgi:mannose-6-phosphate isomerase-like protein (cupin superfamily)
MLNKVGRINKGWGHEQIIDSNFLYCLKFLVFEKEGAKCSMHFHKNKLETWYIDSGEFELSTINTEDASTEVTILQAGSTWINYQLEPHSLKCLKVGRIIETSTPDHMEDNYKIIPGDSQNGGQ